MQKIDDHFEPIETIFKWVGYAMFATVGVVLIGAGLMWIWFYLKAFLTVGGFTLVWLICYLLYQRYT